MKIYIAGKITGLANYKAIFEKAEATLQEEGHAVMNPAILPGGFSQDEYMHICYNMIDVCDGVYLLNNWRDSPGAKLEHEYAIENGKWIKYQDIECNCKTALCRRRIKMNWNDSCWLIHYKNGYKVIISEEKYIEYKKERDISDIYSEEHWFISDNCIEANQNLEVIV